MRRASSEVLPGTASHLVNGFHPQLPSGKQTFCYGKSQFLMGESTISMAIFNSYVKLPEVIYDYMEYPHLYTDCRIISHLLSGMHIQVLGNALLGCFFMAIGW